MDAETKYHIFQIKPGKAIPVFIDPDDPKSIKAIQAFPFAIRSTGRELSQEVRQVTESFDEAAWEHLEPIERAQLRATRPDMCPPR